jgi:hypothetical protein
VSTDGLYPPAPRPVPELALATAVSDDDRNRYGVLLDNVAERGLLTPAEYRQRLTLLAEAPSIEDLQRIVTEFPSFNLSAAPASSPNAPAGRPRPTASDIPDPAALDAAMWATLTPATSRRASGGQWLILGLMVVILIIAMVVLGLIAAHMAHSHHASIGTRGFLFSPIRL